MRTWTVTIPSVPSSFTVKRLPENTAVARLFNAKHPLTVCEPVVFPIASVTVTSTRATWSAVDNDVPTTVRVVPIFATPEVGEKLVTAFWQSVDVKNVEKRTTMKRNAGFRGT